MKRVNICLIILMILISIVCRSPLCTETLYFKGDAIAWVLALVIIVRNVYASAKIIAEGALFLTVSNLIDELCFDPTKTGLNEYIFFLIILIWTLTRIIKQCKISKMN